MSQRAQLRRRLEIIRLRASDATRELGCALQNLDQIDLGIKAGIADELESAAQAFAGSADLLAEAERLCDDMKKEIA